MNFQVFGLLSGFLHINTTDRGLNTLLLSAFYMIPYTIIKRSNLYPMPYFPNPGSIPA